MPGELVHTNELSVMLGDNWFVEKTAKEASQVIGRRQQSKYIIFIIRFT